MDCYLVYKNLKAHFEEVHVSESIVLKLTHCQFYKDSKSGLFWMKMSFTYNGYTYQRKQSFKDAPKDIGSYKHVFHAIVRSWIDEISETEIWVDGVLK